MEATRDLSQWLVDHLVVCVLVLTRLSTLLMAMPAISAGVPKRVRAMFAIMLTALLVPTVVDMTDPARLPSIDNLVDLAVAIGREALVGMLIGATVQLIVTGIQLAGETISGTGGMQLGQSIDSTSQSSVPTLAKLVGMMVTAVLLLIGGHRVLLNVLVDSFRSMPAGNVVLDSAMMDLILTQLTSGMIAGIRVAAPVVGALLLSNLITGLVSRTLPQLNVLAIGLSINALAMLVVTSLTIGTVGYVFRTELGIAVARLQELW
ncbi:MULTISPECIES: flagellar biosynthetic protein FliR [Crateriforma]|uniref:Flagellar biosynthetic protein FliR n=1 Tax=Crateriforma conspicua TaxID=2527996 RepID=A0A5C6FRT1_9PLAN|nr:MULTISPECIES: flagellar biosynthetic protein FliR [Crateriforma]TWU64956.1 Flagellar biosynthetic protein FliR [Crateriforma conspicua]